MTAPALLGPSPQGGGPSPAPLPQWEETAREAAAADDRYWDARYDNDDED